VTKGVKRPSRLHVTRRVRFAQLRGLGRKVSDEFTVPLCRGHHREVHRSGDEVTWWNKAGIDPTVTARALWLKTHPLPTISDQPRLEGSTSVVGNDDRDLKTAKRHRPARNRNPDGKTNPVEKAFISQ
jgi:hypothetical protein